MGEARRERLALLGFEFEEDEAEFQVCGHPSVPGVGAPIGGRKRR